MNVEQIMNRDYDASNEQNSVQISYIFATLETVPAAFGGSVSHSRLAKFVDLKINQRGTYNSRV